MEKLESFLEVSKEVDNKLCYLWSLADQICPFDYPKSLQVYGFANRMSEAWRDGDEVIAQDVQGVQIVSCTMSNVPLSSIIEKIQSSTSHAWDSIQKITSHVNCMTQFKDLNSQITTIISRLQDGNYILRYFLSICKAIPYLKDLETVIDRYTENITQYVAIYSSQDYNSGNQGQETRCKESLSAFPQVIQLLTEELLGNEPLDPHSKIEPIVKHEMPEIPKSAYINPFPPTYNTQNVIPNLNQSSWNYGNMIPNATVFDNSAQHGGSHYYPVILPQRSNYPHIISESSLPSYSTNSINQQMNGLDGVLNKNLRLDSKPNNRMQKMLPEVKSSPINGTYIHDQNVVSVLLLESTAEKANGNNYDRRRVESIIKLMENGKKNMKRMTLTRRKFTRRARSQSSVPAEVNDLPPIKMPTLKQNLLTPLSED